MKQQQKRRAIAVGVLLAVGLVALVIAVASGYLYIGLKSPQQVVRTPYQVCDESMINTYNKIRRDSERATDDAALAKHEAAMQELSERIKTTTQYDKDPTCSYMLLGYQLYYTRQADAAEAAFKQLETAVNTSGGYADHRLKGLTELNSLKSLAESFRYANPNANVGD